MQCLLPKAGLLASTNMSSWDCGHWTAQYMPFKFTTILGLDPLTVLEPVLWSRGKESSVRANSTLRIATWVGYRRAVYQDTPSIDPIAPDCCRVPSQRTRACAKALMGFVLLVWTIDAPSRPDHQRPHHQGRREVPLPSSPCAVSMYITSFVMKVLPSLGEAPDRTTGL